MESFSSTHFQEKQKFFPSKFELSFESYNLITWFLTHCSSVGMGRHKLPNDVMILIIALERSRFRNLCADTRVCACVEEDKMWNDIVNLNPCFGVIWDDDGDMQRWRWDKAKFIENGLNVVAVLCRVWTYQDILSEFGETEFHFEGNCIADIRRSLFVVSHSF